MEYIKPNEMRAIDINSSYHGVGFEALMENAGRAVFEELIKIKDLKERFVTFVCGTGNNGGDGFVAAGHLVKKGIIPMVYLVGKKTEIKTTEAKKALSVLEDLGVAVQEVGKAREIEYGRGFIVDGVLGTGIKGDLREPVKGIVERINGSTAYKVSIDVPTGLGTKTFVRSDLVVAMHRAKEGLENFKTVVRDIGIPDKASSYVGPGDLIVNLYRKPSSHKGDNGRVLVVGGSHNYSGAPLLSGLGALGSGSDLVTILVPDCISIPVKSYLPDFIVRSYPGEYLNTAAVQQITEISSEQDVCVIGPGLGVSDEVKKALNDILSRNKIPIVLDADALKQLKPGILKELNSVVTPHAAEFKALTGETIPEHLDKRKEIVEKWAERLSATILLKSPVDIIASKEGKSLLNETGNPGMTVGGTGDVLAGVVGGFIAQGMTPFTAACCAAFVNGAAADALYNFKGYGFSASDVAKEIPYTIKRVFDLYG